MRTASVRSTSVISAVRVGCPAGVDCLIAMIGEMPPLFGPAGEPSRLHPYRWSGAHCLVRSQLRCTAERPWEKAGRVRRVVHCRLCCGVDSSGGGTLSKGVGTLRPYRLSMAETQVIQRRSLFGNAAAPNAWFSCSAAKGGQSSRTTGFTRTVGGFGMCLSLDGRSREDFGAAGTGGGFLRFASGGMLCRSVVWNTLDVTADGSFNDLSSVSRRRVRHTCRAECGLHAGL